MIKKIKDLFPEDECLRVFGKKQPTVEEIKKFLYKNGQREFWDYQVHGLTLRMKDKDLAMIVRLKA